MFKSFSLLKQLLVVILGLAIMLVAVVMPIVDSNVHDIIDDQMYEKLETSQRDSVEYDFMPSNNKEKAMQMLKAKLYLLKEQEQAEKVSDIRGEIKEIGFGNQIRSYVMQPYTLVKDHRTNVEIGNVSCSAGWKY